MEKKTRLSPFKVNQVYETLNTKHNSIKLFKDSEFPPYDGILDSSQRSERVIWMRPHVSIHIAMCNIINIFRIILK